MAICKEKIRNANNLCYNRFIYSLSNSWTEVHEKLSEYFAIYVKMVWVVDPQLEQIHVYRGVDQVKLLHKSDTLSGEDVLPDFQVALTEIFVAE